VEPHDPTPPQGLSSGLSKVHLLCSGRASSPQVLGFVRHPLLPGLTIASLSCAFGMLAAASTCGEVLVRRMQLVIGSRSVKAEGPGEVRPHAVVETHFWAGQSDTERSVRVSFCGPQLLIIGGGRDDREVSRQRPSGRPYLPGGVPPARHETFTCSITTRRHKRAPRPRRTLRRPCVALPRCVLCLLVSHLRSEDMVMDVVRRSRVGRFK
jgi:hypothetical protein